MLLPQKDYVNPLVAKILANYDNDIVKHGDNNEILKKLINNNKNQLND